VKYPSTQKACNTFIQIGLAGAIASSFSLALPSPAQADDRLPPSTAKSTPVPSTSATVLISPSAVQGIAAPEALPVPERSVPALPNQEFSLDPSAPQTLVMPETSNLVEFSPAGNAETVSESTDSIAPTPTLAESIDNESTNNSVPIIPQPEASLDPASGSSTPVRVLSPTPGTVLDVPATTIILQYPVDSQTTLQVNGAAVDSALIGRTETDPSTNLVTQTWYGVGLRDGQNIITVQTTMNGVAEAPVSVEVVVRGAPSQLTVEPVESGIPADGRSTATLEGELLDENNNRSNRDAVITLEASSGEFAGTDYNTDQPGFQVQARQGQYTATLRSSLDAGVVRIRAVTGELEAFNQIEFQTSLHPTLISGVVNLRFGARGTDFFGSFRDFLPADEDNNAQLDVSGAVFATTPIGEWQFTGAFNSDRPLNRDCNGEDPLFRVTQTCDQDYPVYGDGSTSDIVTPSTDQVYARIERTSPVAGAGSDFLMWGDYSTADEFATRSQLFTATTRELHGLYGNYNLGNLRITAFYGNNVQGFQRDTIAPDGTSGFYFLSNRLLVLGSENVFIETEEFNRPGTVLESQQQTRGADYQIDYDRGTVLFNQPILRTDVDDQGRVLVRRIVVTYQYENNGNADIYGGRVQYNLSRELNRESWIGGTYVRENQGNRNFELYGADALISLGGDGQLIAEYAHSQNDSDFLGAVDGSAYRVEAQGTLFGNVQGRAYYRSTDAGFTNNATTSFVPGQTRYGTELTARLSSSTSLRASYDHEDNFGIAPRQLDDLFDLLNPGSEPTPGSRVDNSLTTITVGLEQLIGEATLGVDWIHRDRQDRMTPNALTETSDQLRSRLTVPIIENLTFRAQNELNLSGGDPLYPNRTILGLDWQFHPGITLSLNQQFFSSQESGDNSITSLDLNGDYHLSRDTRVIGRFSLIGGRGLGGSIGLQQGITLAPGLRATLAYEHIFANEFNYTGAGAQFPQPYAVGQSASALGLQNGDSYSVGLEYTDNPNFQANARFEHRSSSRGSNTVISASALGRITPDLTALLNFQQASSSNQSLSALGTTSTLRLGLAYRDPEDDRFNALLRYEYRRNPSTIPDDLLSGSGTGSNEHLLALEGIYAPDWRWEFYGKFALRNSTSYLASDLVGTSTITLAQARATYRLGYRWDVAAEARWISQPSADYSETGFSLEAGYYLTANLRLSGGYSFGAVSDRDFDNSRSAGGPYLGVTIKLDNNLFRDFGTREVAPPQQQESVVEPIAASATPAPLTLAPLDAEPDANP
jgi:hypothetical protein